MSNNNYDCDVSTGQNTVQVALPPAQRHSIKQHKYNAICVYTICSSVGVANRVKVLFYIILLNWLLGEHPL